MVLRTMPSQELIYTKKLCRNKASNQLGKNSLRHGSKGVGGGGLASAECGVSGAQAQAQPQPYEGARTTAMLHALLHFRGIEK
jgi:hypothetical protein